MDPGQNPAVERTFTAFALLHGESFLAVQERQSALAV